MSLKKNYSLFRRKFNFISKSDKVIFSVLFFITVINIIILFSIPEEHEEKLYSILNDLLVGFISSFVFYIIVNFIPDVRKQVEEGEKHLFFRAAIQRETENFTTCIIDFWASIAFNAYVKKDFDISRINRIEELLNYETIEKITNDIKLEEGIDDRVSIDVTSDWYRWSVKFRKQLSSINRLGNEILTRYKENLEPEVFYSIYFLLNESQIVGGFYFQMEAISQLRNGRNFRMSDCFDLSTDKGKKNIIQSSNALCTLYSWCNKEYTYIISNIKSESRIKINRIDFKRYMEKREFYQTIYN